MSEEKTKEKAVQALRQQIYILKGELILKHGKGIARKWEVKRERTIQ